MAKKTRFLFFILLFSILLSSFVLAEDNEDYYAENTEINLQYPCYNDYEACSATATCNITILYPNSSVFILNQQMTNNNPSELFNYTFTTSSNYGRYKTMVRCNDDNQWGNDVFFFNVNQMGVKTNPLSIFGGIIALIIMTIVYLYSAFSLKDQHIGIKVGLYILSFVNIIAGVVIAKLMINNYYAIDSVLNTMITVNTLLVSYMLYKIVQEYLKFKKNEKEKDYR